MQEISELRADIARLGLTHWSLARIMQQFGDTRDHHNILRSIQRMASGELRYSGEMRVVINLLEERRQNTLVRNVTTAAHAASLATHAAALQAPRSP